MTREELFAPFGTCDELDKIVGLADSQEYILMSLCGEEPALTHQRNMQPFAAARAMLMGNVGGTCVTLRRRRARCGRARR